MSKFVVDSNVFLKLVLPESDSAKAVALRDGDHQLVAPDIFPLEISHVLSKLARQRKITADEARTMFVDLLDERPALKSSMRLVSEAFEICLEARCTFWDALYLALGKSEICPVITADERLVRNVSDKFHVIALSEL